MKCFRGNISASSDDPAPLMALNEAQGLEIDADTARSRWTGEPMDYGWSLGGLFHLRDMARLE